MLTFKCHSAPLVGLSKKMKKAKVNTVEEIQYKASLPLQILLYLNVYLSIIWTLLYGVHILYNVSQLKDFHGVFVIVSYLITTFAEYGRLYAGYSGNLRARTGDLSSFLIVTLLIQLPIQVFLLISVSSQVTAIAAVMALMFVLMLLEFFIGIYTWHSMATHQTEMYKIKRQLALERKAREID